MSYVTEFTQPLKELCVTDYKITQRKGHLSVILKDYPVLDSVLWVLRSLNLFYAEIYLTFMHSDSYGLKVSYLSLSCTNSLHCFSFFSDIGVDLGVDPPATQPWSLTSLVSLHGERHYKILGY